MSRRLEDRRKNQLDRRVNHNLRVKFNNILSDMGWFLFNTCEHGYKNREGCSYCQSILKGIRVGICSK